MNVCLMSKVDKYGRGSAAANGEGFVDLAPGDTFAAVEINQDAKPGSTPRGAISEDLNSAPFQDLTSQLTDMVSYYVGDVNRTQPKFVGRDEMFSTGRTVELLEGLVRDFCAKHQEPSTKYQAPKFSIIIPVYNVAPYLRECLDSVLAQTFTDWEAICVDDGSTDGSGAILDEYKEKVEKLGGGGQRTGKFVVIHQQNAGVSAARNAALENAGGEWICFLDGDDKWRPDLLCRLYEAQRRRSDLDCIRIDYYKWGGESTELQDVDAAEGCIDSFAWIWREICRNGPGWRNVWRRSRLVGLKFVPDLRMCEDGLFALDAACRMQKCCHLKYAGYLYRCRDTGASRGWIRETDCVTFMRRFSSLCISAIAQLRTESERQLVQQGVAERIGIEMKLWVRRSRDKTLKGAMAIAAVIGSLTKNGCLRKGNLNKKIRVFVFLLGLLNLVWPVGWR